MEVIETKTVTFTLGDMIFEYDEQKNKINIEKHGISFKTAAHVFADYNRIELFDEQHSEYEDRYNTIGDISGRRESKNTNDKIIEQFNQSIGKISEILFVVYTERIHTGNNGKRSEVTRLISARLATNFERGIYYGKYDES